MLRSLLWLPTNIMLLINIGSLYLLTAIITDLTLSILLRIQRGWLITDRVCFCFTSRFSLNVLLGMGVKIYFCCIKRYRMMIQSCNNYTVDN
jgi:hypothetical protein